MLEINVREFFAFLFQSGLIFTGVIAIFFLSAAKFKGEIPSVMLMKDEKKEKKWWKKNKPLFWVCVLFFVVFIVQIIFNLVYYDELYNTNFLDQLLN